MAKKEKLPEPAKDEETTNFSWVDVQKAGEVVVEAQGAITVYINSRNQLVIRQESRYDEEDQLVTINKEYVEAVIAEMQRIAKEI